MSFNELELSAVVLKLLHTSQKKQEVSLWLAQEHQLNTLRTDQSQFGPLSRLQRPGENSNYSDDSRGSLGLFWTGQRIQNQSFILMSGTLTLGHLARSHSPRYSTENCLFSVPQSALPLKSDQLKYPTPLFKQGRCNTSMLPLTLQFQLIK